jgi:hypothetical protein
MTRGAKVLVVLLSGTVIVFARLTRIDAKVKSDTTILVTDRWTGHVYVCDVGGCYKWYPR